MTQEHSQNPFIIFCKHCRHILADSFSLLDYKNDYLLFSSISSSTKLKSKKITSDQLNDKDCTFVEIECSCGSVCGRKYITVTKKWAGFVERFCFAKESVGSYMLGMGHEAREVSLSEVSEEVEKLKRFCVYLHKRIEK